MKRGTIGDIAAERVKMDVYGLAKPKLRGMVHAWSVVPFACAGIILTLSASTASARFSLLVYTLSITSMLGASAAYHRLKVSERTRMWLRRIDHSMIGVAVAGTYTPVITLTDSGATRAALLGLLWLGALGGFALILGWPQAPRWLRAGLYISLGWAGVVALPTITQKAGIAALVFVVLGGVLYTCGAVVYGMRKPNPVPGFFGFHEVFHSFVVAAVVAHFVAVAVVVAQTT